jgi:hypothetical protein
VRIAVYGSRCKHTQVYNMTVHDERYALAQGMMVFKVTVLTWKRHDSLKTACKQFQYVGVLHVLFTHLHVQWQQTNVYAVI